MRSCSWRLPCPLSRGQARMCGYSHGRSLHGFGLPNGHPRLTQRVTAPTNGVSDTCAHPNWVHVTLPRFTGASGQKEPDTEGRTVGVGFVLPSSTARRIRPSQASDDGDVGLRSLLVWSPRWQSCPRGEGRGGSRPSRSLRRGCYAGVGQFEMPETLPSAHLTPRHSWVHRSANANRPYVVVSRQ